MNTLTFDHSMDKRIICTSILQRFWIPSQSNNEITVLIMDCTIRTVDHNVLYPRSRGACISEAALILRFTPRVKHHIIIFIIVQSGWSCKYLQLQHMGLLQAVLHVYRRLQSCAWPISSAASTMNGTDASQRNYV